jgi:hypothetical protein
MRLAFASILLILWPTSGLAGPGHPLTLAWETNLFVWLNSGLAYLQAYPREMVVASFTLAGPSFQQVYQVETSTNLVDWEPVPGPRHYGYPTRITKPVNLSEPRRFFRGVNRQ